MLVIRFVAYKVDGTTCWKTDPALLFMLVHQHLYLHACWWCCQGKWSSPLPLTHQLSRVMGAVLAVLIFNTLIFTLWMLTPRQAKLSATNIFFYICSWVWKSRAMSPGKSRSFNCFQKVHWLPFNFSVVDVFINHSIARKRKNDKHKFVGLTDPWCHSLTFGPYLMIRRFWKQYNFSINPLREYVKIMKYVHKKNHNTPKNLI